MKFAASSHVASRKAFQAFASSLGSIACPKSRPSSWRTSAAGPSINKILANGKSAVIPTGSRNRSLPGTPEMSLLDKSKRKACLPPSMKHYPTNPQPKSTGDLGRRVSLPRRSLAKAGSLTAVSTASRPAVGVQTPARLRKCYSQSAAGNFDGLARLSERACPQRHENAPSCYSLPDYASYLSASVSLWQKSVFICAHPWLKITTHPQPKSRARLPKSTVDLRSQPLIWGKNGRQTPLLPGCWHSFCPITTRQWECAGQKPTETDQKLIMPPLIQVVTFTMNCFNLFH